MNGGTTLNINARKDGKLDPELAKKIDRWLISFRRLDPRYKILKFFNQVASEGADDFVDDDTGDEGITDWELGGGEEEMPDKRESVLVRLKKKIGNLFDKSSILTVWRPCSNDAMRKMMEGTGVGKGLDIKGKSAKKGILSAFVPFLQISEEMDKAKIMPIAYSSRLRVYYHSEAARKEVVKRMRNFAKFHEDSEDLDLASASDQIEEMEMLDKFAPESYGIELGMRLFWTAVVVAQNITRTDDSTDGTATGRASSPGFQDANNDTLKKATKAAASNPNSSAPIPVLLQYDKEKAMRPQTLLIAYEENGNVIPVVSDFDCFLLGWRREALWFGCNLPREQEDLMMWEVDKIEEVLSDCHMSPDPWTIRWLDIKKDAHQAGINFDSPPYGYGDPKSYGIMEKAASRMKDTGAVRHGSECFNYGFPQEIDEDFLLVSDTLDGVPWRYLDVEQLQSLLIEKLQEGFVFPLNPKWILCDPGWKDVYDTLMQSDALYADTCRDVWYPTSLGIRQRIETICQKHPRGFQRASGKVSFIASKGYSPLRQALDGGAEMSGNAYFELAELELENYYSRKNTLSRQIALATEPDESEEKDDDKASASRAKRLELYRRDKKELVKMRKEAEDIIELKNSGHISEVIDREVTAGRMPGIQSERPAAKPRSSNLKGRQPNHSTRSPNRPSKSPLGRGKAKLLGFLRTHKEDEE
ncbi:unnamed protein product [Cylindrotheca closterium]|uniref:Uncharacterized protein n=1 Tax=Cylindrotheca closterium TaxID=2856 RepID=A0AAD2GBH8_9STRA|nr:unnamed protein product [Cylindrotheca closterium]